ncbi:hypothetical protein K1X13_03485 [Nocardioides sp. WL0053]|uniref:YiaAB two helix domain-containing protein n=1 Tax=Nocardioides jiangsuensis TaxID=2866161 RepID=A0ABS7RFS0_9ACTN|nr:YiaA/YiaB family inner membrane protein [Nocardioides jiangsuensis]MBY9073877.1 hypothetical protein [Nocardioides jiangsuensis]
MSTPGTSKTTTAFFAQAGLSFGIALLSVVLGICYLPVDPWMRAFLAVGTLFLVTSSFTLAKCVRDAQETSLLATRLDQARVEKILSDHDPYHPLAS